MPRALSHREIHDVRNLLQSLLLTVEQDLQSLDDLVDTFEAHIWLVERLMRIIERAGDPCPFCKASPHLDTCEWKEITSYVTQYNSKDENSPAA